MNLYELHTNPKELMGYSKENVIIPTLAFMDLEVTNKEEFAEFNIIVEISLLPKKLQTHPEIKEALLLFVINEELTPYLLTMYATDIINGRFKEAELIIREDEWAWKEYKEEWNLK